MRTLQGFFLRLLRQLLVRNLALSAQIPSTKLVLSSSPDEGAEEVLFEGSVVHESCNPSWSVQKMTSGGSRDDVVNRHWRDKSLVVRIEDAKDGGKVLHQQLVIFKQLLFMGRIELHHFTHLPLNAIFFQSDEGLWVLDDQYTILHKYLSVSAQEALLSTRLGDFETKDTIDEDENENEDEDEDEDEDNDKASNIAQSESDKLLEALRRQVSNRLSSNKKQGKIASGNDSKKASKSNRREEMAKLRNKLQKMETEAAAEERRAKSDARALASFKELEKSLAVCEKLKQSIKDEEDKLKVLIDEGIKNKFLLDTRQLVLVGELQALYPIERLTTGRYTIRGLEMLSLDCPQKDEEALCTALGYLVHLLSLLSKYLGVSLRYQMLYFSSRSVMRDPVVGVNAPLYRKDMEIVRFKRAISWLRSNIEQLMDSRGLIMDRNSSSLAEIHRLFTTILTGTQASS